MITNATGPSGEERYSNHTHHARNGAGVAVSKGLAPKGAAGGTMTRAVVPRRVVAQRCTRHAPTRGRLRKNACCSLGVWHPA